MWPWSSSGLQLINGSLNSPSVSLLNVQCHIWATSLAVLVWQPIQPKYRRFRTGQLQLQFMLFADSSDLPGTIGSLCAISVSLPSL